MFVGSMQAATDSNLMRANGITHVVNCMQRPSLNRQLGVCYFNFDIERWQDMTGLSTARSPLLSCSDAASYGRNTLGGLRRGPPRNHESAAAVKAFFAPVLEFIAQAVEAHGNVLIHCFAGAHRAGTTGVAYLMHQEGLRVDDAIQVAQRLRPVIDPKAYRELHALLVLLEDATHD